MCALQTYAKISSNFMQTLDQGKNLSNSAGFG